MKDKNIMKALLAPVIIPVASVFELGNLAACSIKSSMNRARGLSSTGRPIAQRIEELRAARPGRPDQEVINILITEGYKAEEISKMF